VIQTAHHKVLAFFTHLQDLVFGQKKLAGSIVGGRSDMDAMFRLAADKGVAPLIERMPSSQVFSCKNRSTHVDCCAFRLLVRVSVSVLNTPHVHQWRASLTNHCLVHCR
jgi:D-arabinose 1-dehydrogenase-like Zn-dependent alcohol dehydrogenase